MTSEPRGGGGRGRLLSSETRTNGWLRWPRQGGEGRGAAGRAASVVTGGREGPGLGSGSGWDRARIEPAGLGWAFYQGSSGVSRAVG